MGGEDVNSHELDVVERLSDKILILHDGHLKYVDHTEKLKSLYSKNIFEVSYKGETLPNIKEEFTILSLVEEELRKEKVISLRLECSNEREILKLTKLLNNRKFPIIKLVRDEISLEEIMIKIWGGSNEIIKAETKKYFEEMKAYCPDHIVGFFVNFIFFIGFFLSFSKSNLTTQNLHIGFIYWYYTSIVISEGSVSISFEKQTGTFEQLLLKPVSILWIVTIRTWAWIFITTFKVVLLMFLVSLTLKTHFAFDFRIIPILIITLLGVYGFGMLLTGTTLLFNKAASFESIISYLLLFFTGGIISLEKLPAFISNMAEWLPLTLGIRCSQDILNGNPISMTDIYSLILNSSLYFAIGLFIFNLAYNYSIKNGLSSSY